MYQEWKWQQLQITHKHLYAYNFFFDRLYVYKLIAIVQPDRRVLDTKSLISMMQIEMDAEFIIGHHILVLKCRLEEFHLIYIETKDNGSHKSFSHSGNKTLSLSD